MFEIFVETSHFVPDAFVKQIAHEQGKAAIYAPPPSVAPLRGGADIIRFQSKTVSILLVQDIFGRFLRRCPQDLATVDKITHGGEWYQQLAAAVKSMNGTEHSAPSNREPGDVAQDKDLDFDLRHKNAEMQTIGI